MNLLFKAYYKFERIINRNRVQQLKQRLKSCGENVFIDHTCHFLVPERMEVGANSSFSSYTTVYATFGVKIGRQCLISSNCGISSYNHVQNSLNRRQDVEQDVLFSKPVIIGDNVWIGMNVCILPGVEIGDNSIIGSGSVVTKSVPSNEVWVGNPARFVKKLDLKEVSLSNKGNMGYKLSDSL